MMNKLLLVFILILQICTSMVLSRSIRQAQVSSSENETEVDFLLKAKQSIFFSRQVLVKFIDETMPGSLKRVKDKDNHKLNDLLRGEVLPILSELASVQISYEREIIMNENSSDYVKAANEVLKHTIQSTCTWVKNYLNMTDNYNCSPEILQTIKVLQIVERLERSMLGRRFGTSENIHYKEYQQKVFNCDSSIRDSVKQTVAELVSQTSDCR